MSEQAIFRKALAKADPAERAAYLDEACAGSAELRAQVEELLRAHGVAGTSEIQSAPGPGAVPGDETRLLDLGEPGPAGEPVIEASALPFLTPSSEDGSLGRLGHYQILEVVGKGGMGVVLKARDTRLQRVVAVKVLAPQLAASSTARRRFAREAQAAAAIRDEHVVRIHGVEEKPVAYLIMEFVAGGSLEDRLRESGPLPIPEVLAIGMQTARGLAAAHAQGLIHRDVKPGNILLEDGLRRVKITDFGLARAVDDASVTQSGAIAGTPLYMSPEQARGETVDHRTDLFSLGSVLYTLCAGRPAFRGDTAVAVLRRVCEDTPRPLREINPDVPVWLEGLILRLLEKDAAARFQTAAEVAELLGQCLAHVQQPTNRALPASLPRPRKPSRRRGWVFATAALCLVAGLVGGWWLLSGGGRPQGPRAPGMQPIPDGPLDTRQWSPIPAELLALAGNGYPEQVPPELVALFARPTFSGTLLPAKNWCHWPAHTPDGKLVAVPSGKRVLLLDAVTGVAVRTLSRRNPPAFGDAFRPGFSRDGTRVAAGSGNEVVVWQVASGAEELVLAGHTRAVYVVAFSPDGKLLATSGWDGKLKLWDAHTGQERWSRDAHENGTNHLAFGPDGKRLASVGGDHLVKLWDPLSGEEVATLREHTGQVKEVAFSPDGKVLATGGESSVILWDLASEKASRVMRTPGWGLVAFTPDGKALLAAAEIVAPDKPRECTRWDPETGKRLGTFAVGGKGGWQCGSLSPDGRTVVFVSAEGQTRRLTAHDSETGRERVPTDVHHGAVRDVAFSPDGGTIASAGDDGTVRLWDLGNWPPGEPLPPARVLRGHTRGVTAVAFSPDGRLLASVGQDDLAFVWDAKTGAKVHAPLGSVPASTRPAFSADGKTLATGRQDGTVDRWDLDTGGRKEPWRPHADSVRAVACSADGRLLASTGRDRTVQVSDAASGRRVSRFPLPAEGLNVAFSRDGKLLAVTTGDPDPRLLFLDPEQGKELAGPGSDGQEVSWTVLEPATQTSKEGATLTKQADGSILVTGKGPQADTYTVTAATKLTGITAIRLEVLPDDSLPGKGPGRASNGNFVLSEFRLGLVGKDGDADKAQPLAFVRALADYSQPDFPVGAAIDNNPGTGWAVFPQTGKAHTALFELKEPLNIPEDGMLVFALEQQFGNHHMLGKFRLSATTARTPLPLGSSPAPADSGPGQGLAVHPEGRLIATGSPDGTVRFWDLQDRRRSWVLTCPGLGGRVDAVAFSPTGRHLVVGHAGGAVSILRTPAAASAPEPVVARPLPEPAELAKKPAPADALKRENIPPGLLKRAGGGDPARAPPELVAVLGEDVKFHPPHRGTGHWYAVSPDGRVLAVPCGANLALFDTASGALLRTLTQHGAGRALQPAFSPDGKRVASGSDDSVIRIWDVTSGREELVLRGHAGRVHGVAFSPDGKRLASAGYQDKAVRVWHAATGECLQTLEGHTGPVLHVCFSPDGKWVASAAEDRTVRVWDAEGKALHTLEGHTAGVWISAFSPDGKRLVTGSESEALVWDTATFKEPRTVALPAGWLAFAPDGKSVFGARLIETAGQPHTVVRWDQATGERLGQFQFLAPPGKWMSHALSPDGKTLYVAGHEPVEPVVHVYDVATGKERDPVPPDAVSEVLCVGISPDGRRLAAGSGGAEGFSVRLYDLATGTLTARFPGHTARVRAAVFSPDGKLLASCDESGWVQVHEVEGGKLRRAIAAHQGSAFCLAFTPDGKALASGGSGGARLWELDSGRLLQVFPVASTTVGLAFSPDGKRLAGDGSDDKTLHVWDTATGWQLAQAEYSEPVRCVAFHPAGDRLAFGAVNGSFGILDLGTGKVTKTVAAHGGEVVQLAWRADGRLLASSGGSDKTTRIWALDETGDRSQTFPVCGPAYGWAHGVAFTPEGRHLATANPDGTVSILRLARPGEVYQIVALDRRAAEWALAAGGSVSVRKGDKEETVAAGAELPTGEFVLTEVNLAGSPKATDEGLKDLAGLTGLTQLNLERTAVTDAGLTHLARLKTLKALSLKESKVTAAGVARLREALPECNVAAD